MTIVDSRNRSLSTLAVSINLSNPTFRHDLVRFLRDRGYLAIEEWDQIVAVPLPSLGASGDQRRVERDLAEWHVKHPGAQATVVAD